MSMKQGDGVVALRGADVQGVPEVQRLVNSNPSGSNRPTAQPVVPMAFASLAPERAGSAATAIRDSRATVLELY
jgi:hypothetical protein